MPLSKLLQVIKPFEPGGIPTITMWNRIEGRPRKKDFSRELKAEIRDPLWMLTKQWQLGEFEGDDAGSPILAKVMIDKKRLTKVQMASGKALPYNNDIPLEAMVEQMPVTFESGNLEFSLDLRIMMGRYWLKLIRASKSLSEKYAKTYPINAPTSADDKSKDIILAHPEAWQKYTATAQRRMDGYKFYVSLKQGIAKSLDIDDEDLIYKYKDLFINWIENFFVQPQTTGQNAFLPSRLEYQFKCSVNDGTKEKILEAEEYYSGKLDWFNLSINEKAPPLISETVNDNTLVDKIIPLGNDGFTFIPVNIDYPGMPDTRWWKFEDSKTYLGDIKPDTTDISKLLFLEFSLLYANDWFLFPQELPAATIAKVNGLVVTNCFGERTLIEPSGKGTDDNWHRWTMYTLNKKGEDLKEADNSMLILPTVPKILESPVLEQIAMVRDEISNMVWAIETDILLPSGDRKKGTEAARELAAFYKRIYPEPEKTNQDSVSNIRYKIMNTVPENWIPFIPVHVDSSNREIQLQRASMPRILHGISELAPVKPRTGLLRYGLDGNDKKPYFVYEEEVPRAGIIVTKEFQRTRWYNGKVYLWLGIHKTTGRGEGQSNLQFDQLVSK